MVDATIVKSHDPRKERHDERHLRQARRRFDIDMSNDEKVYVDGNGAIDGVEPKKASSENCISPTSESWKRR
jgi:hypothetical protein